MQREYKTETGADLARATMYASFDGGVSASSAVQRLGAVPGVRSAVALAQYDAGDATLTVAPCATLREVAGVTGCRDGDVFFAGYPERRSLAVGAGTWRVPAGARTVPTREDPTGIVRSGVFATPAAVRGAGLRDAFVYTYLRTDVRRADADESVRNAAAALSPLADVRELRRTRTDAEFAQLRRAMLVGASIVIGLIGLSLLLTALEQLRERRRLLAVLVAFGTRRSTLSWSILWQSAVPVAFGLGDRGGDRAHSGRGAVADRRHGRRGRLGRRLRDGGGRRRGRAAGHRREPARAVADHAPGGAQDGVTP